MTSRTPYFIRSSLVKDVNKVYPIDPKHPGSCLIINNVNFDHWSEREGSDNDAVNFGNIFRDDFCFDVQVKRNQTVQEMETEITEAVNKEHIGDSSCFVLIILSHGLEGVICGTDSPTTKVSAKSQTNQKAGGKNSTKDVDFLSYKKIVKLLSNEEQQGGLKHKPKICFFQACGGCKKPLLQADGQTANVPEEVTMNRLKLRLPPSSDILLSFASQKKYKAYRKVDEPVPCDNGGIYARYLHQTLIADAKTCDLEDMLKTVEKKMRLDVTVTKLCMSTSAELIGWSDCFYFYPIQQDNEQNSATVATSKVKTDSETRTSVTGLVQSVLGRLLVMGGNQPPEFLCSKGRKWKVHQDSALTSRHQGIWCSQGKIYVFDPEGISIWNPSENTVSQIQEARFQNSRPLYAYAVVNQNIYIMGGRVKGEDTDECFVFNSEKESWDPIDKMSTETSGRTAVVLKDKIYITPGTRDLDELDELNPQNNTWNENIGKPMKYRRCGHGMATCGTYVWVFGGNHNGSVSNFVERYNFGKAEWETMPPMPNARANLSVSYFQGMFYAIGGKDGNDRDLDVVEIFNPVTSVWTSGPKLTNARSGHTSIVIS